MFEIILISLIFLSALIILMSSNPIYSILQLIVLYCSYACYLLTVEMEFLACILILVNVGAVAVLFLFIVMLININVLEIKETMQKYYPYLVLGSLGILGIVINVFLFFKIQKKANVTTLNFEDAIFNWYSLENPINNKIVTIIGLTEASVSNNLLNIEYIQYYTNYLKTIDLKSIGSNLLYGSSYGIWFILACLILLVGMIGVIYITEDLVISKAIKSRRQIIGEQVDREIRNNIKGFNSQVSEVYDDLNTAPTRQTLMSICIVTIILISIITLIGANYVFAEELPGLEERTAITKEFYDKYIIRYFDDLPMSEIFAYFDRLQDTVPANLRSHANFATMFLEQYYVLFKMYVTEVPALEAFKDDSEPNVAKTLHYMQRFIIQSSNPNGIVSGCTGGNCDQV